MRLPRIPATFIFSLRYEDSAGYSYKSFIFTNSSGSNEIAISRPFGFIEIPASDVVWDFFAAFRPATRRPCTGRARR